MGYVRYGDDFVLWCANAKQAEEVFIKGREFLFDQLHLCLHHTNNVVQPTVKKLHFLGVEIWPEGHRLDQRMRLRMKQRTTSKNIASYQALAQAHGSLQERKWLLWESINFLDK